MRRIISVLIENEAGALSRVVGLFAQRNYNIETLNVAPTDDETLSRLTLTTVATDEQTEQITKQLNKLIEVVKLVDLTDGEHIERELMLIKVKRRGDTLEEGNRTCDLLKGEIVEVTSNAYTIRLTGSSDKLDAFINSLSGVGVREVVGSGVSGLSRGKKSSRFKHYIEQF